MSLPLTRRIAKAALLTAAGAATVVGAAGASSAAEMPKTPDVGGLTNVDGQNLGGTVDSAAQETTGTVADTGSAALQGTLPAAGETLGSAGKTAVPAAQDAVGGTAGQAGQTVGQLASATSGLASDLPVGQAGGALGGVTEGTPKLPLG
ncbi:ATP-binding protein [Streptomyces sp. HNM0574]|uniref:ATP-binding protein n=1 Tax=Streptomyces sp. HNM0574 TaxID=2714954 RepID=UPI00146F1F09|nr:ATP-binding protein [Streptomyces sp. HNM0574]NLU67313.1 ATP-binding protein [Streptomyces sp. HNM0574]